MKPLDPRQLPGNEARLQANDYKYKLQRCAARLLPEESVCKCGRHAVDSRGVQVVKDGAGRAFTRGLVRCKSVWHCPVCAAKIAEKRRSEYVQLLKAWRANGGHVYMLTLTLPHNAGQGLVDVLTILLRAWDLFNSGRNALPTMLEDIDLFGQLRALEVTHGDNGWHPHQHILLFTREYLLPQHIEYIQQRWASLLAALGFPTVRPDVAAQVQGGDHAAEYVSKTGWGMAEEISRAHTKKGGRGGQTPFQLLESAALGCQRSARLFQEYAVAFKGRKQVFMSRSLAAFAADHQLEELDDAVIIEREEMEVAEIVGYIAQEHWNLIYRYEMRAELLHAVELRGAAGLEEIVLCVIRLDELKVPSTV
ncbi:protein rep [Deinococcus sp. SL84]|uniref:protein rep n=1 Tax=Deinococcus sp. SL84 TaxID=2994663 RepID=UPI002272C5AC|nr:protein rep [Deinococcus sp. SL84]MCY1703440.1 protein rep [Deinococcus sp. SL84]